MAAPDLSCSLDLFKYGLIRAVSELLQPGGMA